MAKQTQEQVRDSLIGGRAIIESRHGFYMGVRIKPAMHRKLKRYALEMSDGAVTVRVQDLLAAALLNAYPWISEKGAES